ncbi:class I SAM-dependent methyltransferase, partial [Escherichia coli]|nr:class I SAM-dependent methyltransferase [Escherichia coli]
YGTSVEEVTLIENGVKFIVPLMSGQKTGWFYDHRDNRACLKPLVAGKQVLDVFSYLGGWGIQALQFGAKALVSIDSSAQAVAYQKQN